MASDVMSLFGMDPNVIQQNRVQSGVDAAARMNPEFAIGAAGGQMMGSGLSSLFGMESPEMAQAASVQRGMQGADLTTVAGLRAAAQKQMMEGNYPQAMALHAQARDMEALENKAPSVSSQKTYMTPDGKELVGYVVDGVPSYRKDGSWIPLPDGSTIKDTSAPRPFNITQGNIDSALLQMDKIGINMSTSDKNSAARWIANRKETLERSNNMDPNTALVEATNEANAYVEEGWLWFNDSWNPPTATQPAATAQPAANVTAAGTAVNQNALKYLPK